MKGDTPVTLNSFRLLVIAALAILGPTDTAHAQARLINVSDTTTFIARYTYSPARSEPDVQGEGWRFSGWTRVEPGTCWEGEPGHYYLKNRAGPISPKNLKASSGFVTDAKFDELVLKDEWNQRRTKLLASGYQEVEFHEFPDGAHNLPGNAYRVREKAFPFDFSSRAPQSHNQDFQVAGRVAYVIPSSEEWGASDVLWGHKDERAYVTLVTEGQQKKPFGPREPGYYRGKVTVFYIEKK
jgi:hypothetical protein